MARCPMVSPLCFWFFKCVIACTYLHGPLCKNLTLRRFGSPEYAGQVPSLCCLETWYPKDSLLISLNSQRVNNNLIQSMNWSYCKGSTFSYVVSPRQHLCPVFFLFLSARKWRGDQGREQRGERRDPPQSLNLLQICSCVVLSLQWAQHLGALANAWTLRQRQRLSQKTNSTPTEGWGARCAPTIFTGLNVRLTALLPSGYS